MQTKDLFFKDMWSQTAQGSLFAIYSGRVDFLEKQKLKFCSWEGTKMRSFGGRPRFGLWLESRSFYVKKCDPRSHSVQSRGDVDVVPGGRSFYATRGTPKAGANVPGS